MVIVNHVNLEAMKKTIEKANLHLSVWGEGDQTINSPIYYLEKMSTDLNDK